MYPGCPTKQLEESKWEKIVANLAEVEKDVGIPKVQVICTSLIIQSILFKMNSLCGC